MKVREGVGTKNCETLDLSMKVRDALKLPNLFVPHFGTLLNEIMSHYNTHNVQSRGSAVGTPTG